MKLFGQPRKVKVKSSNAGSLGAILALSLMLSATGSLQAADNLASDDPNPFKSSYEIQPVSIDAATGQVSRLASSSSKLPSAASRSLAQMTEDPTPLPLTPLHGNPFLPTINRADYQTRKSAAIKNGPISPSVTRQSANQVISKILAPATLRNVNCKGAFQSQQNFGWPPDTEGAIGDSNFVEIVNSAIVMSPRLKNKIDKKCGGKRISLNKFFGYFNQPYFDPRVAYDPLYKRWIVTAEAFPESASTHIYSIAVSKTQKAQGKWFIYHFNVNFGNTFFDFPQLGFDADAVIVTANVFAGSLNPATYLESIFFSLSKSRLYNGVFPNTTLFSDTNGTIAPPIVRDLGAETWLASAGPEDNKIRIYRMQHSGRLPPAVTSKDIPVTAYLFPPFAPQAGTPEQLDTGDSRFVNAGTQIGNFLYNVHAINDEGFSSLRRYKINVGSGTAETITFFSSDVSQSANDFNAAIAVDDNLNEYLSFSTSFNGTTPLVRFGAKSGADANFTGQLGTAFVSPTSLTNNPSSMAGVQRWGDYSAVTIDPVLNSATGTYDAWLVNEEVNINRKTGANEWGSRVTRIGIP